MRSSKPKNIESTTGMSRLWEDSETMGTESGRIMEDDYTLSENEAEAYVEAIEMGVIEED